MENFGIIVHGGAGKHRNKREAIKGVIKACKKGFSVLEKGGSAIDAVCAAVSEMEDNPYFNAGFGSVLTIRGTVEMDASIMVGNTLKFGAVAGITGFKNPILIARRVMEKTSHLLLIGKGAEEFALLEGFKKTNLVSKERLDFYFKFLKDKKTFLREELKDTLKWVRNKYEIVVGDTVGACAVDSKGNTVSGTSTGGIFFKMEGRVGDTPCPGCGTYANSFCAVSATGLGEAIMRVVLSKFVCDKISEGLDVMEACKKGIEFLEENTGGKAGVIAITKDCEFGYFMNTETMPVAFISKKNKKIKVDGI